MTISSPASVPSAPFSADLLARAAAVRLMAFDIDGVFTDGHIYYGHEGESLKAFHTLDGFGVKQIARAGVEVAIITGRRSGIVAARAAELGIERVYQGASNKADVLATLLADAGFTADEVGYMGDDWADLPVLCRARLACAPINAHRDVRERAHYVTTMRGGDGAVREVCDLIVRARGNYDTLLAAACGY